MDDDRIGIGPAGLFAYALPRDMQAVLTRSPLFADVPVHALEEILTEFDWIGLPGGKALVDRGDTGEALYIVLSGGLGLILRDPRGEDYLAAHLMPGQVVGELAVLLGEERTATLVAMRDTEVLKVSHDAFERLIHYHPQVALNLSRVLGRRLQEMISGQRDPAHAPSQARTIALVPLGLRLPGFADLASGVIKAMDPGLGVFESPEDESRRGGEAAFEQALYVADRPQSAWTQRCLRQADCVVLVARAGDEPQSLAAIETHLAGNRFRWVELVILDDRTGRQGNTSTPWAERLGARLTYPLNPQSRVDTEYLARQLSGRAVGVVLSGGGARAFAHIGVLRALREAQIPYDLLGGTNLGGLVSACAAMGWSVDEIEQRLRDTVGREPPLPADDGAMADVLAGRRFADHLMALFGETRIEAMPRVFFCVSANLSDQRLHVHRKGLVWQALRASAAMPGVLAPAVMDGAMVVDGSIMNALPADVMAGLRRGPVIGVDVTGGLAAATPHASGAVEFGIIGDDIHDGPNATSILMRSHLLASAAEREHARAMTDLLIEPDLSAVAVDDYASFDTAVDAGYRAAKTALADHEAIRTALAQRF